MGRIVETKELYKYTINEITQNENNWQNFLDSASWNFKYDFDDQILIYAQRPDAKACASMDEWNKKLKRWIKKGTNPIFVFSKEENSQYPFRLVFDKSDTYNYNRTDLKLWSIKPEYEEEIIEALESNFGEISSKNSLQQAITLASYNMVVDNIQDYMSSIENHKKGTMLENMTEDELRIAITTTACASVSYMMMSRCGINPKEHIDMQEFVYISNFNSYEIVTALGSAVSDIAEMGLREIARTVNILQKNEKKKNRIIEKIDKEIYANEKGKGGIDYDENRVHGERGLQNPEYNNEDGGDSNREIRESEIQILEGTPESRIDNNEDRGEIERTSYRNTGDSHQESRTDSTRDGETGEYNRGIESTRPDEVGTTNEQLEDDSRGDSLQRDNIRLTEYRKENDIGYVVTDEKINQILATTTYLNKYNREIIAFYNIEKDIPKRAEYIKELFNNEYTEIYVDDNRYGYKKFENGVLFWKDAFLTRTAESFVSWENLTYHFDSMILLNQLKDKFEPIKSESEQITLIDEQNTNITDFEFTQEFIDRYLQEQTTDAKYQIYEFFNESLSSKENSEFLKNLYGMGGASHTIKGSGIGQSYDAKGLKFNRGYLDKSSREQLFKWTYIEKRISELIKNDRYLNSKEMEEYPIWHENKEQQRIQAKELEDAEKRIESLPEKTQEDELAERVFQFVKPQDLYEYSDNSQIYSTDEEIIEMIKADINDSLNVKDYVNRLKSIINDMESTNPQRHEIEVILSILEKRVPNYEYHLGDNVFIGADEYYISSIDSGIVTLNDANYPLFSKQMPFDEFERKVQENNANEHLIAKEQDKSKELQQDEEIQDNTNVEIENKTEQIENNDITPLKEKIESNIKRTSNRIQDFILHPEVAEINRNNYKITNNDLGVGTPKEKYVRNIEAIKTLKKCEQENRYATPEEQEILSQYVGWGGLQQAFNKDDTSWSKEYEELKSLLNDEEYEQARGSVLTAFYTPPIVINAIYQALQNMGLKETNILEPSCRCRKLFRNVTK